MKFSCVIFLSFIACFSLAFVCGDCALAADKEALSRELQKERAALENDALEIWRFAEIGFKEFKSSELLQNRLKSAGFSVNSGIAGMPTAFVASFKNGDGPVIAILAEYDALKGLSQSTAPTPPARATESGHGCGHNLIGAASVHSAIALSRWMTANGVAGEVRIYGCPAEEGGAGKVYLVREGFFDEADAVLHWHPTDYNGYYTSPHMATISGKFRFRGLSSHAAAAPERGRSALDGATIMSIAVEFLREHIPDGTRIHYVITNRGQASNVVPEFAEIDITVRHADTLVAREVWSRVNKAANGAAMATETEVECEISSGAYPLLINKTLIEAAEKNFNALTLLSWDAEQSAFAGKIADSLTESGELDPTVVLPPYPAKIVNASTDVGDISWAAPTVGIFTMAWVPGTVAHSWQSAAASGSKLGTHAAYVAAEILCATAADLFTNKELLQATKEEFETSRGDNFVYEPLLGYRAPALDYLSAD